jgi:hypothetical protein
MFTAIKLFFGQWSTWLVVGAIALLLVALGGQTLRLGYAQTKFAEFQAKVAGDDRARAEQRSKDERAARDKEKEILAKAAAQKKVDDEKIVSLTADAGRLERLLRNRPMRPGPGSAVAGTTSTTGSGGGGGSGATGAELYLEDGAVLAGEATRAERLLIQRDSCIRQYNQAREALKKQKPGATP